MVGMPAEEVCLRIAVWDGEEDGGPGGAADLTVCRQRRGPPAGEASDGALADAMIAHSRRFGRPLAWWFVEQTKGARHAALQVADPDRGALAHYRATHLSDPSLAPGAWLTLVPCLKVRLGLLAAGDLLDPETARALTLAGAQALLGLGLDPPPDAALGEALVRTRARENGLPLLAIDVDGAIVAADAEGVLLESTVARGAPVYALPPGAGLSRPRQTDLYRILSDAGGPLRD